MYDALRRAGLSYEENIRMLLEKASSLGMISHLIDLSLDATHLMYHGTKKLKACGTPFSTWLNPLISRVESNDCVRICIRALPLRIRFRVQIVVEREGIRQGEGDAWQGREMH